MKKTVLHGPFQNTGFITVPYALGTLMRGSAAEQENNMFDFFKEKNSARNSS